MGERLGPAWSKRHTDAGTRFHKAWDEFFGAREAPAAEPPLGGAKNASIAAVRARHEERLMRYANVVAVSEGIRTRNGSPTGERCIVVYVDRKVPRDRLAADDVLPAGVEGMPIDVVEAGRIGALKL